MRKLILARGHPGSGKSHTIMKLGLSEWTLSADRMRYLLAAPLLTPSGQMILNQDVNSRVFSLMSQLADERMSRGETLLIDYTFAGDSMKRWLKKAHEHRYQVAVLDMSKIPLDVALERNSKRRDLYRVSEYNITQMYNSLHGIDISGTDAKIITGAIDGSHINELDSWLREPVHDFSMYKRVVHIGDIQGCHSVVVGPDGPLANGFRDDTAYIFVGDLLDRGLENGKVMRWFVDNAMKRENVFLLWGNHEHHLHLWSRGKEAVSNEFNSRTLPQLIEAGITQKDADAVCDKAKDFLEYKFNEDTVLVTHAGLSTYPQEPHLVSLEQFSKGTGYYTDPVDEQFERNTSSRYQVHGHRNHGGLSIQASSRSFNLEGGVEHGGFLRTCTLDKDGWTVAQYKNDVFRPLKERLQLETPSPSRIRERRAYPHWITSPDPIEPKMDAARLDAMLSHDFIYKRQSELHPHIYSLNFTKKAFFKKAWDDITVRARGLFLNGDTNGIVARGYDKFFNVGEREETQIEVLAENLHYPLNIFVKYNGYLGNIGYDDSRDLLMIASKSSTDGEFAHWFKDIVYSTMSDTTLEQLARYLRDTESSMTFEVIDPINDPHMIEYDQAHIVLLDIIRRTPIFEKASQDTVEVVAKKFGLQCKEKAFTIPNKEAFVGWLRKATSDMNYKYGGKNIEGFIIEDSSGFMTKVKLRYYSFWKQMRGMKDRIAKAQKTGTEFSYSHVRRPDGSTPDEAEIELAHEFRGWCEKQDLDTLKLDIITLRNEFLKPPRNEIEPSSSSMRP